MDDDILQLERAHDSAYLHQVILGSHDSGHMPFFMSGLTLETRV